MLKKALLLKRIMVAVLAVVLLGTLSACYNVPSDMVAVQVGDGPFEAKKIKDCKPSADRGFWTNDDYRLFPTNEREWDATGKKGSDSGRFSSVTKDNVEMLVPVTVRFTLKTDCDTLKDFYTRYARRYNVEFGSNGEYNDRWILVLRKLVADPADTTLDRIIQDYNWRDVWNNPNTKAEIERRLTEELTKDNSLLVTTARGEFFEGISVLIEKASPKTKALREAVALEQTNVAKSQSAEATARADEAKARAEIAVSQAEAEKKMADIKGYGSFENYLRALMVQEGLNPLQPTYVWGGSPTPSK